MKPENAKIDIHKRPEYFIKMKQSQFSTRVFKPEDWIMQDKKFLKSFESNDAK